MFRLLLVQLISWEVAAIRHADSEHDGDLSKVRRTRTRAAVFPWTSGLIKPCADVALEPVDDENEWRYLKDMLSVRKPHELNRGRDVVKDNAYTNLKLVNAWRVQRESYTVGRNYTDEAAAMRLEVAAVGGLPRVPLFEEATSLERLKSVKRLQSLLNLDPSLNEKLLLHGTKGHALQHVLCGELDVPPNALRGESGLLGWGAYLAEQVEKIDQYMKPDDTKWQTILGLNDLPAQPGHEKSRPARVYYGLGVKALLGHTMPLLHPKTVKNKATGENLMADLGNQSRSFEVKVRHEWTKKRYFKKDLHVQFILNKGYNAETAGAEARKERERLTKEHGPMRTKLIANGGTSEVTEAMISNSRHQAEKPEVTQLSAEELDIVGFHSAKVLLNRDGLKSAWLNRFREYFLPYWSHRVEPVYLFAFARCQDAKCQSYLSQ